MLAQQIETALPRTIQVPTAPVPGGPPVAASFRVSNPTAGTLSLRFRSRPFLFRMRPGDVHLAPGAEETVRVEIDAGKITGDNYRSLEVIATWSVLERNEAAGKASTRNGEHSIRIEVPEPRRPMPCPDPACGQVILSGDRKCGYCGALLRYCPECRTAALQTATRCNALAQHPLPRLPDWPLAGGNPARSGAVGAIVRPQASLAWRYSPPSPKPPAVIEWSSPAVLHDMVFLAGAVPGEWSALVALDARTGAEIWQYPLPERDAVYPYRGGPSAAGGLVFVATVEGYLLAVDVMRGRRRWVSRLPHRIYGGCMAAGNALFVGTIHRDAPGGHVLALWPEEGEKVWATGLPGHVDTPLAAGQGRVFACCDDGALYALNARDGTILWQQATGAAFEGGPVVADETVYCANAEGTLAAFDAGSGEPRWREALPAAVEAAPAVDGGRVYCACADGQVYSYTTAGKHLGSAAIGSQVRAAPVPAGNGALVAAEDGHLYFTDAIRQVSPLYHTEPGTRISAPLAASGTRVFLAATNGCVYAVDVEAEG